MIVDKLSYENIKVINYDDFWNKAKSPTFEIDKNKVKEILHEYYDIKHRLSNLSLDGKCDYINTSTLVSCIDTALSTCGLTKVQMDRLELWMQGESGTKIAQTLNVSNKVFYTSLDVSCSKIAKRLREVVTKCLDY